jgi:hypothetical protein
MDNRLPTEVTVSACLRQCSARAIPAYVLHKGAAASGTIMVKIVLPRKQCKFLNQSRDIDGNLGWMHVFDEEIVDEKRADDYISRSIQRDPDVWVVEVEDASGESPFEGKIF